MVQPHRHCTKNSFNMSISAIDYVTQWLSHVRFFTTPWTVTHQAPLSMGFSRQEYWSGLPFSTPRDLPDPETEFTSLASPAMASGFFTTGQQIIIPNLQMRSWRFSKIKGFDHKKCNRKGNPNPCCTDSQACTQYHRQFIFVSVTSYGYYLFLKNSIFFKSISLISLLSEVRESDL